MLYICIPVHDEAPTIGVLLWRIRGALQELTREYEIVVYDDGSTDVTPDVLEPYEKVVPLTVLRGARRQGYAHAVDQLARFVAERTPYPRRDAMVVMQGDFTDRPEDIPDLLKRFEGGADVVVTERQFAESDPTPARRFGRVARWALRPFVRLDGVAELTSTYRLIRVAALRDLLRERGDRPLLSAPDTASANAELLMALRPHVRRVESIAVTPRYDARVRLSRIRPLADAWTLARFAWRARGGKLPRTPIATRVATAQPGNVPIVRSIAPPDAGEATPLDSTSRPRGAGRRDREERRERRPRGDRPTAPQAGPGAVSGGPAPTADERAARRARRERREAAAAAESTPSSSDAEAVVIPLDATDAESSRDTSRRRSRSRRRKRGTSEAATASESGSAIDAGSDGADLSRSGQDADGMAVDDAAATEIEGAGDDPSSTRARRSRRGRKRRRSAEAASDGPSGVDGDVARERPSSEEEAGRQDDAIDLGGGDGDGGGDEPGTPRSRRSRRGRRRSRRAGGELDSPPSSEHNGGDSGDAGPPRDPGGEGD